MSYAIPLFQLFHEAGHYIQYVEKKQKDKDSDFWEAINNPTGREKAAFEEESWIKGRELLLQFIHQSKLNPTLLEAYDRYAQKSTNSYC